MLEKTEQMILLMDFYQAMLTEKQQEALELYYEDDLTLSEIADKMKISRQAVHDMVQRSENILQQMEAKLELLARFQANRNNLEEIIQKVENLTDLSEKETVLTSLKLLWASL